MKTSRVLTAVLLVVIAITVVGCQQAPLPTPSTPPFSSPATPTRIPNPPPTTFPVPTPTLIPPSSQALKVTFLDVGQADCTVIQYGNSYLIIDAGGNATASSLVSTLKKMGISRFDYLIGTHPHEDHIGGLDAVINNFAIGTIYMPRVSNNTRTFEDVLLAIKNNGLTVTTPVPGSSFILGDAVQCTILAPNGQNYPDLNSYSIVLKASFNSRAFIFTGDAESDSEGEMLAKGYDLKADVLKVGHHGSTSSTSAAFLKAVSPSLAVIFVGKDNTYGHPHRETLQKLNAAGIKVYRTDLNGTITITVNGTDLMVTAEKQA